MTLYQRKALEYVRNTGGGATLKIFIEDWEPIGQKMWDDVEAMHWVEIRENGKIYLTEAGEHQLR